ncbi:MAG TPA: DUF2802 domain-containing protein [Bdellovibrionales bacterium]|nr:DUF2802 domain-containing protein [Bdellovibrionales bacterium]
MSIWLLVQVAINLALILGLFSMWNLFRKFRNQEDPRLSRGLQLLQSKIAVLEDLSDRTETQVKQLTALINSKIKEIHDKTEEADRHVLSIERSIAKSLEVSKIFQDKIPHQEIIERQATAKYIEAARLANRGLSLEEIAQKVDIPRGELELIVRMNKDQMVFSESEIPEWAKTSQTPFTLSTQNEPLDVNQSPALQDFDRIREQLRAQSAQTFAASATSVDTPAASSVTPAAHTAAPGYMSAPATQSSAATQPAPAPVHKSTTISTASAQSASAAASKAATFAAAAAMNSAFEFEDDEKSASQPATRTVATNTEISFAAQVLEEQLQTEAGQQAIATKTTAQFGIRKSSVLPKDTKTTPYAFKRIKVERP